VAVVAAVADGHGGRRYIRSEIGSAFAVQLAVDVVAASLGSGSHPPIDELLEQLVPEIVHLWRTAVERHVSDHPFTAAEVARAGTVLEGQPLTPYGSTLVVAVLYGSEIGIAQLGDGDLLVRTLSGSVLLPVPTDDRLVAGETTSLCLPGAEADFRYAFLGSEAQAGLVVLATDGYGNSFASDSWRDEVGADLADLVVADGGWTNVEAKLPAWLAESAEVGGDDVTAVVLVRRVPVTARLPAPPAEPPHPVPRG
jgi:protein phosphatase 2C-like protein